MLDQQLDCLSRVVPVFVAIAIKTCQNTNLERELRREAENCFFNLINIGLVVSASRGQYVLHLNEDSEITTLLDALETRISKRKKPSSSFLFFQIASNTTDEGSHSRLRALADFVESQGLGGFDECSLLASKTTGDLDDRSALYLEILHKNFKYVLFHDCEIDPKKAPKKNPKEQREKFLNPIRIAIKHLFTVYFGKQRLDDEELKLTEHPSIGAEGLENTVYRIFDHQWKCNHRTGVGAREARLSLINHRPLVLKFSSQELTKQDVEPASFELLLPVCNSDLDTVNWKILPVKVNRKLRPPTMKPKEQYPVEQDVCDLLSNNSEFMVNFSAEKHGLKLWHSGPIFPEDAAVLHYTATEMTSLYQLLDDFKLYQPEDKLILCYILANSMLFLYRSPWVKNRWNSEGSPWVGNTWNSKGIHFIQPFQRSSFNIKFPYLSAKFCESDGGKIDEVDPTGKMYHHHPAILSLGIIFLEIVTGKRFPIAAASSLTEQCKRDGPKANDRLNQWKQERERCFDSAICDILYQVIKSCLSLKPLADSPSISLKDDGPIRHYIFSCIVQPLATALKLGFKVQLEKLIERILDSRNSSKHDIPKSRRIQRGLASVTKEFGGLQTDVRSIVPNSQQRASNLTEGDRQEVLDRDTKKSYAEDWFNLHEDVLTRLEEGIVWNSDKVPKLRNSGKCDANRVKIAILDSGLRLSALQKLFYDPKPEMIYQSFIKSDELEQPTQKEDDGREQKDDNGHGTHLAVLLRKIAPEAIIHVGRVYKHNPELENSGDQVALALNYAVKEWEVDIIVLSLGFSEKNVSVYNAIQAATSKDILVFAAASNEGSNGSGEGGISWPANEDNLPVICIHSGDGKGNKSTFNPNPRDGKRIMVLGDCVKSAWPTADDQGENCDNERYQSGTSCAAAIAAGIAAVFLDYARGFLDADEWALLRRPGSIQKMFKKMCDHDASSMTGFYWVRHWNFFHPEEKEDTFKDEVRRWIR